MLLRADLAVLVASDVAYAVDLAVGEGGTRESGIESRKEREAESI